MKLSIYSLSVLLMWTLLSCTSTSPVHTGTSVTAYGSDRQEIITKSLFTSDIYYKHKVFHKNEAKAFATCETILMDTRTGVVPHSSIVTREKHIIKDQQDLTDSETE